MLLDQENTFHDNVTLPAAAVGNVMDMRAPTNLGGPNFLASGGLEVFAKLGTKGNVDNTIALTLEGADDEAMGVNKINVAVFPATNVAAGGTVHLPIPHHVPKRFFRLTATVAGTTAALNNFKAFLLASEVQRSLAGTGLV